MKTILWSIRTFWYRGLTKTMKNDKFEKKLSCENTSSDKKMFFTRGSKNQWNSRLTNAFQMLHPFQTQRNWYTKSDKDIVKTAIRLLLGIPVSRIFALIPRRMLLPALRLRRCTVPRREGRQIRATEPPLAFLRKKWQTYSKQIANNVYIYIYIWIHIHNIIYICICIYINIYIYIY